MLIFSWNVAGLSTTVNRIHECHPPTSAGASKRNCCTALEQYFSRHHADIVCLQEHKIPKEQLTSRSEPRQCSHVAGYESFWSCCVDETRKGLNGVVTYAKQGTVVAADAFPLDDEKLNRQGRCVATDHGGFWLWNVYAPACRNGMSNKMEFLTALRKAMQEKRKSSGKPQILVGDLNITHTELDLYWKDRCVHVQDILDEMAQHASKADEIESIASWKKDIYKHWSNICSIMETQEAVETKTTNSITKEQYQKFRLAVTTGDGRRIFLGKHEIARDYCFHGYDFSAQIYTDAATGEEFPCREANVVRIEVLAELMSKLASVTWGEPMLREIAATHGSVPRKSPHRDWLSSLIKDDGMVDVFRHFFPKAEARFTYWNQFTNRRYSNEGLRLDYTLVDKSLLCSVKKESSLRCCGDLSNDMDALSETAALRAATANGRFQPVSFEGGGMTSDISRDALDSQFDAAHTGMIYTPPLFSDHIGVSLYFEEESELSKQCRSLTLRLNDPNTRKAQPHKLQPSIASFFQKGSNGIKSSSSCKGFSTGSTAKRQKPAAPKKPSVNSILYHFQKKTK